MSDQQSGPGWWQASDGKWYPPESHPGFRPAPPPPGSWQSTPVPTAMPGPYVPQPPLPAERKGLGIVVWTLIAVAGFLVVGIIVAIAASAGSSDSASSGSSSRSDETSTERSSSDSNIGGSADEVDDVGPCIMIDNETLSLDVTNNSSGQSSYIIDVNFLDEGGQRVGDESVFVSYVRAGERALEQSYIFDSVGGTTCEVAEVERHLAESPDDVTEVACEVTGLDDFDDIATKVVATNGSSELSDYYFTVAIIRDDVRIGTGFGSIENVKPGQSAPGDAYNSVDGPAAGVACVPVHVQRTSSE